MIINIILMILIVVQVVYLFVGFHNPTDMLERYSKFIYVEFCIVIDVLLALIGSSFGV